LLVLKLSAIFILTGQFFKVEKTITDKGESYKDYWGETLKPDEKLSFAGVKDHAEAHYNEHARTTYYEGLSDDQKHDFKLVESYLNARNSAATIYSHLKKLEGTALEVSGSKLISQEEFKKYQEQRDTLALQIVSPGVQVQAHLEHLKVDEEKLLDHAIGGQTRELIRSYNQLVVMRELMRESENPSETKCSDHAARAKVAQQLLKQVDHAASRHLMKEFDLDFNRLQFDVALNKGLQTGRIDPSVKPEDVYKPIKDYLEPAREVARLWNAVQNKARQDKVQAEPMELMNQSPLKQEWLQMIHMRNENAVALVENQQAMAAMAHMKPGFEVKLYEHLSKSPSFEFKSNTGLKIAELCKEASYFEGLFKRLEATKEMDFMVRTNLRYEISDRMEFLSKTLSPLIADIKIINEPVGAKLEEMFQRELRRELSRDRSRGMEM
jgi:hypothetical protein